MRNNNKGSRIATRSKHKASAANFKRTLLVSTIAAMSCMHTAHAQETSDQTAPQQGLEQVIVTGTRATVQSTINIKRDATNIVDGMSATDIGDLPAMSIGDALANITGASTHRENGGSTEISIRGLGPYLSTTTFNGRNTTNGSGDRSVNFSQFPSELINKVAIYKTQDASLIEGGVAGLIALETLKPLEYGKRRIQIEAKAGYQPNQQNIKDPMAGDVGFRGSASYVDQFEFDNGVNVGISLGYEESDISQPESEMRASSPSGTSLFACIDDPSVTDRGFYRTDENDCEDPVGGPSNSGDYNTEIDPNTGKAYDDGKKYAFAPSSNSYRQNDTSDERHSFFGAFQIQPNDKMDINLDYQQSERIQAEKRQDLNFASMKNVTPGVTPDNLVVTDNGAITNWKGHSSIESNSELYQRDEKYKGYGLNISYDINDRLNVDVDYSYSETTRTELQWLLRTQSDDFDINDNASQYKPMVHWDTDSGIRQYDVTNFDVTNADLFSDRFRARIDNDVDRTNTIEAYRGDFTWKMDGAITDIRGGFRHSKLTYIDLGDNRNEFELQRKNGDADKIADINKACRNAEFPEDDFLGAVRDGALVNILDSDGNVVKSVNSWATFNTACGVSMVAEATGNTTAFPELPQTKGETTDVTEKTDAAYVMADFDTHIMNNTPIRGNFGVRVVKTDVESIGYRAPYTIDETNSGYLQLNPVANAELKRVVGGGSYTEVLPSINVIVDLTDNLMWRNAIYRGLSRPNPSDMSYQRSFKANSSEDITSVDELIQNVEGSGNPNLQPLMSWSFDTALEWYPNQDTLLSLGFYHKSFMGGFETTQTSEQFNIDGYDVAANFDLTKTNDDTSNLNGIEITATHRFSYLPGILSNFGVKASYNYADSDFEFQDSNYGSITVRDEDGNIVSQSAGIVAPANVPGFSKNVFSGQLYYSKGDFDANIIYKYRSEYFQPYTSNGTRLRYVGDNGEWDATISQYVTDNIRLEIKAKDIFDEPKRQYHYTTDYLGELNTYGPRIFIGAKIKFH